MTTAVVDSSLQVINIHPINAGWELASDFYSKPLERTILQAQSWRFKSQSCSSKTLNTAITRRSCTRELLILCLQNLSYNSKFSYCLTPNHSHSLTILSCTWELSIVCLQKYSHNSKFLLEELLGSQLYPDLSLVHSKSLNLMLSKSLIQLYILALTLPNSQSKPNHTLVHLRTLNPMPPKILTELEFLALTPLLGSQPYPNQSLLGTHPPPKNVLDFDT